MDTTPGKRLRLLRSLCGKTRAEISKSYSIPEISLRQMEHDKYRLSEKSALRCWHIYRTEGVHVSLEWIKTGKGLDPFFATSLNKSLEHFSFHEERRELEHPIQDELSQIEEAQFFKQKHPASIVLLVTQDDMGPFYKLGDYVGGIFLPEDQKDKGNGQDCIVKVDHNTHVFRRFLRDERTGTFKLVSLNPYASNAEPVICNSAILQVAPVIWHRRSRFF